MIMLLVFRSNSQIPNSRVPFVLTINLPFLAADSVNIWSPKVIRGGMSAHWRIPIYNDVPWSQVDDLLDDDTQVHVAQTGHVDALSKAKNSVYHEVDFATSNRPQALVIGHETRGLSASALSLSSKSGGCRLEIPMRGAMESLNVAVAGAVILSEMTRQLE